jgi:hypothetical protein
MRIDNATPARYLPAMTYRNRKRIALLVLLVALPLYIVVAVNVIDLFERPHPLVELLVYVALGVAWALPLKRVFKGIGKPDPDAAPDA